MYSAADDNKVANFEEICRWIVVVPFVAQYDTCAIINYHRINKNGKYYDLIRTPHFTFVNVAA
jgi:hypothetical protein